MQATLVGDQYQCWLSGAALLALRRPNLGLQAILLVFVPLHPAEPDLISILPSASNRPVQRFDRWDVSSGHSLALVPLGAVLNWWRYVLMVVAIAGVIEVGHNSRGFHDSRFAELLQAVEKLRPSYRIPTTPRAYGSASPTRCTSGTNCTGWS